MVAYACNPSTWRLRQENSEFEASMGYVVIPFKNQKEQFFLLLLFLMY
jgi:hypothetical protein